jgi:hypothetical protein
VSPSWGDGVPAKGGGATAKERGVRLPADFRDIDRVVTYPRDTKKSAESYEASLAGNLGDLLKQAKDRQAELLARAEPGSAGDVPPPPGSPPAA